MKKMLILLAAVASFNAHAEWVSYQRSADADELYDSKFASRDGSIVKLWTMTNYTKPVTTLEGTDYQSEKMLTAIDCASRKMGAEQVVRMAGRDGKGDTVSVMDSPLRLMSVKASSADERLIDTVCR